MKRIQDSAGARVHASESKEKDPATGKSKITWSVHYKDESVWCNTEEVLMATIRQISIVQTLGEKYKTWKIGENGWHKD